MNKTHPDLAFNRIRSGKPIGKKLHAEVSAWDTSNDNDELNAWCLLYLKKKEYFKPVVNRLSKILSSNDAKAVTNALLILMYADDAILLSNPVKKSVLHSFATGDVSVRINATRLLAILADLGYAKARISLAKALRDPDPHVRDNAALLSQSK